MNSPLITNNDSLLEEQSSKFKQKLNFLIAIVTIFSIIIASIISTFAILKHNIDSQSLPANPTKAIVTVCYSISSSLYVFHHQEEVEFEPEFDSGPEPFDVDLCINSLSDLHINTKSKTNPSKIFASSLIAAINYLKGITSSPTQYERILNCTNSLTHLNNSLTKIGVDPDENILRNKKIVGVIRTWMRSAESEIDACLNGFKVEEFVGVIVQGVTFRARMARRYVKNCLGILENLDSIFNMFYPPIGSVLGSFLMTFDSFVSLGLFCSQFLLLAALFCVLLRLHRR